MHIGDIAVMSKDAIENYGDSWADVRLIITHVATKYMPAKEFYAKGRPYGFHPGYDSAGGKLYDLKRADNGGDLPMSLYGWELIEVQS